MINRMPVYLPQHLLPGRVMPGGWMDTCRRCQDVTHHAALTGERGQELGAHCLYCGQAKHAAVVLERKHA